MPNSAENPFRDHAIVVTGAGTGIGRAVCLELASYAGAILLVGRRRKPLTEVAAFCAERGADARVFDADVASQDGPRAIVAESLSRFGRLDGLVNNAGLARFGPIESASDEDARAMFEINLLAPLRLIRTALGPLRDARGSVVNVSSIGGVLATPRRVMYGATKAGLIHLTRSLAKELAPAVRVNAVVPGPVDTPIYDDLGLDASDTQTLRREMVATTPMGRMGEPTEVARWVRMFVSPESSWVTGSLMTVDGGRSV